MKFTDRRLHHLRGPPTVEIQPVCEPHRRTQTPQKEEMSQLLNSATGPTLNSAGGRGLKSDGDNVEAHRLQVLRSFLKLTAWGAGREAGFTTSLGQGPEWREQRTYQSLLASVQGTHQGLRIQSPSPLRDGLQSKTEASFSRMPATPSLLFDSSITTTKNNCHYCHY